MNLASINNALKKPDLGLLIIRASLGLVMIMHGLPKYLGGASRLESVGEAMSIYGITFGALFWGFLAATVEVVGGALLVLGVLFRAVAFLLFFVLLTAFLTKFPGSISLGNFGSYAHPLVMMLMFLGLLFTGPGAYSAQRD